MEKILCQRWAIVNFRKNDREIGNLGWFTNYSRDDVLNFCKVKRIMIDEDEDVKVVEEY